MHKRDASSARRKTSPLCLWLYCSASKRSVRKCVKDFHFQPVVTFAGSLSCDDDEQWAIKCGITSQPQECGCINEILVEECGECDLSSSSSSSDRRSLTLHHMCKCVWTEGIQTIIPSMKSHCCTLPVNLCTQILFCYISKIDQKPSA